MTNTIDARGALRGALVKLLGAWLLLPGFFLVTGGSLGWWQAWVYCAALLVPMTAFLIHMARADPGFLERRFRMREKERAQRRVVGWGAPMIVATLLVPGIDHRLGWSDLPIAVVVTGQVLVLVSYLAVLRVFLENRWAGRTVETFDAQQVISTGPYALVRHPMYTGIIVLYLATPLALGSVWALIPALGFVPVLVGRIRNEEEILVRELQGYEAYRQQVRWRLLPGVW